MALSCLHWLLGSLCALNRIPFDPALLKQQFPPPCTRATLYAAAGALGFKLGDIRFKAGRFCTLPFPLIGFLKPNSAFSQPPPESGPAHASANTAVSTETSAAHADRILALSITEGGTATVPQTENASGMAEAGAATNEAKPHSEATSTVIPVLVLKADRDRFLYFRAGSETPETALIKDFHQTFEPDLLLVRYEKAEPIELDDDGNPVEQGTSTQHRPFGFRWFIPELLKHKGIWRDVLLASLAIQLVGLTTPLMTQVIIDKVVVHQTHSTLMVVGVALVMFMLFSGIMTWLRQYAVLGAQVFRHLLHLPVPYFEARPTGVLVARLHGVEDIRQFVSGAAVSLFLDVPFLLIFLGVMYFYSWRLTLIAAGILLLIAAISLLVTPLFRRRLNEQFQLGARNQAFVTEYLSGIHTVKSLQFEPVLESKYGGFLASYLQAGFTTRQLANTYNVLAQSLEQVMTLGILIIGALQVMENNGFTVGMLVAFQMFASRMSQPLLRLVSLWQDFQQAGLAVKRLGDILNAPAEPYALIPQRSQQDKPGHIEFQNLSFRYSPQHPYLYRNLSLALKPGHLTVLMGPSGCGKSTLTKLLQGFYPPTDGSIKIDGCDLRYLNANELRQSFGVVPQETVLYSGTVYDNLLMANPHASFEDIIQAAKQAEIHTTIEQLPQGYQTPIGERGVGLSGGQRQRIAIARALLKQPKVLIFDEATAGLDAATVEHFVRTVNALKDKVTILFITHHLPKGLQVDEVYSFGQKPQEPNVKGANTAET